MDIVTVHHNELNFEQSVTLHKKLLELEDDFTFNLVDNSIDNRGFSKACNIGAAKGDSDVIGFLNPDVIVTGPFIETVNEVLASDPSIVITGSSHNKPVREVRMWGLRDWVCGCTMFVKRNWFEAVGGFDERYVWSFEDTDLCRTAEHDGLIVKSVDLPLEHSSPEEDSPRDAKYKKHHFDLAHSHYYNKWRGK